MKGGRIMGVVLGILLAAYGAAYEWQSVRAENYCLDQTLSEYENIRFIDSTVLPGRCERTALTRA